MTSQPFFSCMAQIQIHPYEPFSPIFNPFASQNPRGRERERERERAFSWRFWSSNLSDVGHPGSDPIRLLVMDGIRQHMRHRCCITSPSGQCQPYREWIKGSNKPYRVKLWQIYNFCIWFFTTMISALNVYCP
jgi:hypothetical protein